jgi:phage-related protein
MSDPADDQLEAAVQKAKAELAKHLDEACDTDPDAPPLGGSGGRVRELRDRQNRAWRVWEVRPGLGRPLSDLKR